MKNPYLECCTFLLCAFLLFVLPKESGCDFNGHLHGEEVDFAKGLIFFEQWCRIEGEEGNPLLFIDFPTYRFNQETKTLVSFVNIFGRGENRIDPSSVDLIFGNGVGLFGTAGSGASSSLEAVSKFPFITSYECLLVKALQKDGSLIVERYAETLRFFDLFSFPNPISPLSFVLRPGEEKTFSVTKNMEVQGKPLRLTLTVRLQNHFVERTSCLNGSWGD